MRNYPQTIGSIITTIEGDAKIADDANKAINQLFKRPQFEWYPTYVAHDEHNYHLFSPFDATSYLDMDEFKHECSKAEQMVKAIIRSGKKCIIYFITEQYDDVIVLKKVLPHTNFGILHNEFQNPAIEYPLGALSGSQDKLLTQPLKYIKNAQKLRGKIPSILKDFSEEYLVANRSSSADFDKIQSLIESLLCCDSRFKLKSRSISFVKSIESTLCFSKRNMRDHYFHACNTLMIGTVIMDMFYDQFCEACLTYGDDIVPEFIWTITALFHDIGYPAALCTEMLVNTYDAEDDRLLLDTSVRQMRQNLWNQKYINVAYVLENLYSHIVANDDSPWEYDGFTHMISNKAFFKSLEDSFVDLGSHGAQGVFILMSLINSEISKLRNPKDRKFLYRHIAIGALSIFFHDATVRATLRKNGINSVHVAAFPIAGLLAYVDILQDDRRDLNGAIAHPDIFKEVVSNGSAISAKLNTRFIDNSRGMKLYREFCEALDFFISNGIRFVIPSELRTFV